MRLGTPKLCPSASEQTGHTTGKTRHLFKETGESKGTFHAKMGMIKDRNGKDLTEAEE